MEFSAFAFIIPKRIRLPNAITKSTIKMLTIIRCFQKWDVKLRNVKLEIRTDNKNLKYFMMVKKLTERQTKWVLIFSKYDFEINYNMGENNERVDAFFKRKKTFLTKMIINLNIKWPSF